MWWNNFFNVGTNYGVSNIYVIEDMAIEIESQNSDIDLSIEQSLPELEIEIEVNDINIDYSIEEPESTLSLSIDSDINDLNIDIGCQ